MWHSIWHSGEYDMKNSFVFPLELHHCPQIKIKITAYLQILILSLKGVPVPP